MIDNYSVPVWSIMTGCNVYLQVRASWCFSTFTLKRQPFSTLYFLSQLHGMENTEFLVMFIFNYYEKDDQHTTGNMCDWICCIGFKKNILSWKSLNLIWVKRKHNILDNRVSFQYVFVNVCSTFILQQMKSYTVHKNMVFL